MYGCNQRTAKRFSTIWKVFAGRETGQQSLIGYVMDMSLGGARLFVQDPTPFQNQRDTRIIIHIKPEVEDLPEISRDVTLSWLKTWQVPGGAYEVGVNFSSHNLLEPEYLGILSQAFERERRAVARTEIECVYCNGELSRVESELALAFEHKARFSRVS